MQLIYFLNFDTTHCKIHHEFKNDFLGKKYYAIKCAHKFIYISITETLNCERQGPIMHAGGNIIHSKSIYQLVRFLASVDLLITLMILDKAFKNHILQLISE